ncbi:MAG: hypothetical protein NVSMB64_00690 [Candidatus Velthaea sp.]
MTDDELERALFALPLEEPPADLRARILGATIYRPRLTIRAWEIYVVGTLAALAVWMAVFVMTGVPDAGGRLTSSLVTAFEGIGSAVSTTTTLWIVLGISSALWVSQLTLPQPARRRAEH